ncbi:MAG: hypothetical protein IID01_12370 [Chloroflexi bacterium]|nr:hypothetical protein [Chloroflexota bacterium]
MRMDMDRLSALKGHDFKRMSNDKLRAAIGALTDIHFEDRKQNQKKTGRRLLRFEPS